MTLRRQGAMGDAAVLGEWCDRLGAIDIDSRSVAVDDLVFDERTILKCCYSSRSGTRRLRRRASPGPGSSGHPVLELRRVHVPPGGVPADTRSQA